MRDELAAPVDADGARDATEVDYYAAAADPVFVQAETERRRFRAQFRRRLRHLQARRRAGAADGN
jgi:hypothetical protein